MMPYQELLATTPKVTIRNAQGVIANLHAKERDIVEAIEQEMVRGADLTHELTEEATPVDKGNMKRLLRKDISPNRRAFEVGWRQEDFLAEGLRWYPPYVIFGTSKMPARPVLQEAYSHVEPIVGDNISRAIREAIRRRREGR
jgi:HK97 gp10 family phage protein